MRSHIIIFTQILSAILYLLFSWWFVTWFSLIDENVKEMVFFSLFSYSFVRSRWLTLPLLVEIMFLLLSIVLFSFRDTVEWWRRETRKRVKEKSSSQLCETIQLFCDVLIEFFVDSSRFEWSERKLKLSEENRIFQFLLCVMKKKKLLKLHVSLLLDHLHRNQISKSRRTVLTAE